MREVFATLIVSIPIFSKKKLQLAFVFRFSCALSCISYLCMWVFLFLMTLRSRDFYPKCIKSLSFVLQCKWDSFLILLRTFRCTEVAQNLNCSTHRWISWMHNVQLIYNRVAVKNCFHSFREIYTTKLYSHIEQALIQSHVSSKLVIMTTTTTLIVYTANDFVVCVCTINIRNFIFCFSSFFLGLSLCLYVKRKKAKP